MKKTKDGSDDSDRIYEILTFILAGIDGNLREFEIFGISLQRLSDGAYRCVLRGGWKEGAEAGIRLVGFSNGESAGECLLGAEGALRDGSLRWHFDRYSNENRSNGDATSGKPQFTVID